MTLLKKIYKENKPMVWAAIIAVILALGILVKVKDEVTRFTLIMPVFAGFILFSILTATDEQLGDVPEGEEEKMEMKEEEKEARKEPARNASSRNASRTDADGSHSDAGGEKKKKK